jgi:AraC-like DNA-binding protein
MDFQNIIKIITIFQICLVSLFLLVHEDRRSTRTLLLVLFIGSKALFVLDGVLQSARDSIMQFAPNILFIGPSFQLLLGPAMFYVMLVTTRPAFKFHYRHLLHTIPFVFHLGFMISQYHILDTAAKMQLLQNGFPYKTPWNEPMACTIYLHFAVYGICSLVMLARSSEALYRVTSQSVEANIRYLKFITYDFIIVWGINITCMLFSAPWAVWKILGPLTVFNIFFIANAIVYVGLKFPMIFYDDPSSRHKYEKNLLSIEEKERYVRKLEEFMRTEKPYFNPTLSLADLARQLAVPAHVVSQVLNVELKQNFYDFVNSYRIDASKQLLADTSGTDRTILEVLYQCGFNSKSVFNAAFKKHTGVTPRDFKRAAQEAPRPAAASGAVHKTSQIPFINTNDEPTEIA